MGLFGRKGSSNGHGNQAEPGDDCPAAKTGDDGHMHSCDRAEGYGHSGDHHCPCGTSWP